MVWTAAQRDSFFTATDQLGLAAATQTAMVAEGLENVDDLASVSYADLDLS